MIDLNKELFLKQEKPLELFPSVKPWHYNSLGYKLVADLIAQKIDEAENK